MQTIQVFAQRITYGMAIPVVMLQPHDRNLDTSNHKFMVQYTFPPPGEVELSEMVCTVSA